MSKLSGFKNIFVLITIILLLKDVASDDPTVETNVGTFVGETRDYYDAFEGIRYAKPPIGPLRFEPPVPFNSNPEETYTVKTPGPFCLQWNLLKFKEDVLEGEEDCLFLNVYVPHRENSTLKLPVIFHIHGGAFKFGSGTLYGPKYMTKNGLILVNMQYRLGVLGFLSSGDSLLPGNMGFKDQSLALKWVHENIEAFGGDPTRITLTGWSSGAAASHAHIFSPLSRGLFSSGISHSGQATSHRMLSENVTDKFDYIVSKMDCTNEVKSEIMTCLKTKDAGEIIRKAAQMYTFLWFPGVSFALVVEPPSDHAFITDTPLNLLKKGDFADVPWVASATEDDGLWFTSTFIRNNGTKILEEIDERWNEVAPAMLDYHWIESNDKQVEISKKIREHYFGDKPINRENLKSLTNIFSDRYFRSGIAVAAEYQKKLAVFSFNFHTQYGFAASLSNMEDANQLGVCHGDDILLIHDHPIRKEKPFNEDETTMSNRFFELYEAASNPNFRLEYASSKQEGKLYYREILNGKRIEEYVVDREDFGELEFWKSLEINDQL